MRAMHEDTLLIEYILLHRNNHIEHFLCLAVSMGREDIDTELLWCDGEDTSTVAILNPIMCDILGGRAFNGSKTISNSHYVKSRIIYMGCFSEPQSFCRNAWVGQFRRTRLCFTVKNLHKNIMTLYHWILFIIYKSYFSHVPTIRHFIPVQYN